MALLLAVIWEQTARLEVLLSPFQKALHHEQWDMRVASASVPKWVSLWSILKYFHSKI